MLQLQPLMLEIEDQRRLESAHPISKLEKEVVDYLYHLPTSSDIFMWDEDQEAMEQLVEMLGRSVLGYRFCRRLVIRAIRLADAGFDARKSMIRKTNVICWTSDIFTEIRSKASLEQQKHIAHLYRMTSFYRNKVLPHVHPEQFDSL